ncbi:MAG TPA: response regulator [Ktedonobacterales bacterium]|nr:response regulator [Ktedonobacterales bacterium]
MDMTAVEAPPASILIVEDEASVARMLSSTLATEGYAPTIVYTGEDAVEFALREQPQLILLDLMLPGMDGFEVVSAIRANARTTHIPVMVLTARHDASVKLRAFASQVDDYMTKPFNGDELLARIRTQLRHLRETLLSPLTGLPSGLRVEHAIDDQLLSPRPWAILYLDLDHFKAYNDVYGPLRGNDLIRLLGHVTTECLRAEGNITDFLGHIGGDDFIITTTPDRIAPLCQSIVNIWDNESLTHYAPEDAARRSLIAHDRQGQLQVYPLVGVSIGVVTNIYRSITTMEEFSRIAAEVKAQAKGISGSSFYIDQRGGN